MGDFEHKKQRSVKIGTHSGIFHCDEVLACYLLKQLPQYASADIVRSRDPQVLKDCDIVVDVGGVYDKETHRYDHHQATFHETLSSLMPCYKNYNIRLSSAGLVYVHFGEQIIRDKVNLSDHAVKILFEKIYDFLIQEIDAIDNGIMMCEEEPKYKIHTSISARVGRLNPPWNAKENTDTEELFQEAMDIVGAEFLDKITYFSREWWPAREIVQKSVDKRFDIHPSGKIIELEETCPWKQHLFDLEEELSIQGGVIYAIFQADGTWRVQCVSVTPSSFVCRLPLKKEWQGLRDEELSSISGIPGCIFCHANGFIGGNKTREGALQMAVTSLGL